MAPFDALLDVVVADRLRTGLRPPIPESEEDWVLRAPGLAGPAGDRRRSDAGAHLDTMCGAIYSTSMLGDGVRARGLLSWEQAVRLLTDVPARLYGLRDRGRLEAGGFADIVVFDPATIGHGAVRTRDDLPGGASRLYADAVGVGHVLVNGTEIVRDGEFTGAVPGSVLRSGHDTDTVHAGLGLGRRRRAVTRPGPRRGLVRGAASRAPSLGSSHPRGSASRPACPRLR